MGRPFSPRRAPGTAFFLTLLAAPAAAQAVNVTVTAAPGAVTVAPGVVENAWLYNGELGHVVRATEGQTLRLHFHNQLPESTILHFHGQPVHQGMDGVPDISRPETAAGQEFLYELSNLHPGTYWFHPHSHHHEQVDKGLYGVLIVDPSNPANDPAYDQEQVVVLDDWNTRLGGSGFVGHLLNGKSSDGQLPMTVQVGQRLRLRFVNAAAMTNYVVALDGHPMTVTHCDGNRVQPVTVQALPIGIGERYDVIVDLLNPGVWSLAAATIQNRSTTVVRGILQYQGVSGTPPAPGYVPANLAGGTPLDYAQLASFWPSALVTPNRTYTALLGQMAGPTGMLWTINGQVWPTVTPFVVSQGEVVELTATSQTGGMMHLHPMHLHGHFFRMVGSAGGATHAPIKDTVLVQRMGQPGSSYTVQFTADNPGRWLYHCHDMMHMMGGMMTAFDYTGDADGDGLPNTDDLDPTRAFPVLTVSHHAMEFQTGGSGQLEVQWQPGQPVAFLAGLSDLPAPMPLPPYGDLYLAPISTSYFGNAVVGSSGVASFGYTIPNDPALRGFRIGLQACAGTTLPPGILLSTYQAFTVR